MTHEFRVTQSFTDFFYSLVRAPMKRFSCPSCGRPLFWNGLARDINQFNSEGKRWYQFAGPQLFCKHCGVRLAHTTDGHVHWLIGLWFAYMVLVDPIIVQPLKEEYGRIVVLSPILATVVVLVAIWLRGRYEIWKPPQPSQTDQPPSD